MTKRVRFISLAAAFAFGPMAFADASYQETSQITGGSLVGMVKMASVFSSRARQATAPTVWHVAVQGNRMVRTSELTAEIIDLGSRTITYIDNQKRQYSVVTFAQLQQAMNRASEQLKNSKNRNESAAGTDTTVSFTAKVHETGASKQIDGQDAKETVLTLSMDANSTDGSNTKGSMAVTSDMWMISNAPGYDEMRSFNVRMSHELALDLDASSTTTMLNAQPGASQAMTGLKKEMAKLTGIPVLQTVRMGVTANGETLPPASADASAPNQNAGSGSEKGENSENQSASRPAGFGGGLGRALGGSHFGSMMKRKSKDNDAPPDNSNRQGGSSSASPVLLETSVQRSHFSADAVDPTAFQTPTGYKQVESPLARER